MEQSPKPEQFEFITNYSQNTQVDLKGEKLTGEIDFIYGWSIQLFPNDAELKSILIIDTLVTAVDSLLNTVDAKTELIVNVYKYETNLEINDIYGLFCYATIFNYMVLKNGIIAKNIKHNEDFYNPPVTIPSLDRIKNDIITARNKAYGLS